MLIEQIKTDLNHSRKAHDRLTSGLLTTLLSDIQMIGKNALRDTTDLEALSIVKKFIKGIDDTIKLLNDTPAHESIRSKLTQEKDILVKYIPTQLDESQLKGIIEDLGTKGFNTMPLIMKELKQRYSGQYDGALASRLVKEKLSS